MHTMKINAKTGKWNVGFFTPGGVFAVIQENCETTEAMSLVNYLNGGTGESIPLPY